MFDGKLLNWYHPSLFCLSLTPMKTSFISKFLKLHFVILFSLLYTVGNGQANLLLNGDFEDINTCKEYKAECGVEAWFYMNDVKVQMIHNETYDTLPGANSFAIFYSWKGFRQFTPIIGTILPCQLQSGKKYTFRGWIAARLNANLLLKPGVCVGQNFYVPQRSFSKEMKPDSIVKLARVPNSSFFEFQYSFIATGDEQYLTFGTYVTEDTLYVKRNELGSQTISLRLDNFSLTSSDTFETFCPAFQINKESIYAYDYRHKEMDYSLYGKGKLPVELNSKTEDNLTQIVVPKPVPTPLPIQPDTLKLGDVLFDFNKADLKANAIKMLTSFFISDTENGNIDSIYIEGHTDSVGSEEKNILLSQQRSQSVLKWLVSNYIVSNDKVAIHAFGKKRPMATNKTPAGRALNRRVEIIVFRSLKK